MDITATTRTTPWIAATPAYATTAATSATAAMVAEVERSMAMGDLAMTRRALVAANAAYRAAIDKARGDARTARLDAVMAAAGELETAMTAMAEAKAAVAARSAEAARTAARWEETDLALCQAIDALLAE